MTPKIPKLSSKWQKRGGVILSMILLVCIITTYAFFTDRASIQTNFITSTFKKDGYTLTNTMPTTPFIAGEDVTATISESNAKNEDVASTIEMKVKWTSPDTTRSIFGNQNAADNATIKVGDESISYTLIDNTTISFTLPKKILSGSSSNNERILTLHIPESLASTGEISFIFEKVTIQQSPNGFKQEFESSELTDLNHSVKVGWAASAKEENNQKDLMGYLSETGTGIVFQHEFGSTSSAMKDFTSTELPKWSAYKDSISTIQFVEGMTTIGDYAFKDFEGVTGISLPTSITSIGKYAFDNTSLATLTVPAAVAELKAMSFGHIEELTEITFNHTASDTLTMPTAGSTSGAFYVARHVNTTITTENDDILYGYLWHDGFDNRRYVPTMAYTESWQFTEYDYNDPSLCVSPVTREDVTTINMVDYYRPDGTETSWDASDPSVPGSVTAYLSADGKTLTVAGNGYGSIFANQESSWAFYGFENATAINGLNLWDTRNVTDMTGAFSKCKKLQTIDVSGFDLSKVTKQVDGNWGMFTYCESLTSLDVRTWNLSSLSDFSRMFFGCTKLNNLDVSQWDVGKATTMENMFNGCENLTSLNAKNWDVRKVQSTKSMFGSCSSLASLDVSGWQTNSLQNSSYMFSDCTVLPTVDVSNWDMTHATTVQGMFLNCAGLNSLDLDEWNVSGISNMETLFQGCSSLPSLNISGWNTGSATNMRYMFKNCTSLASIDISSWDMSNVTASTSADMFNGCKSLTTLTFPAAVNYLADGMAANCPQLTTIEFLTESTDLAYVPLPGSVSGALFIDPNDRADVPVLTTLKVTSTNSAMAKIKDPSEYDINQDNRRFQINSSGKSLPVIASQNTWLVNDAISDYSAIKTIEFKDKVNSSDYPTGTWTSWDGSAEGNGSVTVYYNDTTKAVVVAGNGWGEIVANEDSSYMFSNTSDSSRLTGLTTITGLDILDTSNVTSMACMFSGCSSLSSLDVSSWDTSMVTSMSDMFGNCSALATLDVSGWDTGNVISFWHTFTNCGSLNSLDVSRWDTSSATDMNFMFTNCSALTSLDLSNWNTSKVIDFNAFAFNCPSLTTIKLGANFANDSSKLPAAGPWNGSTAGMFYVDSYVETTITGKSTAMEAYDWVADNREESPGIKVTYNANGGTFANSTNLNSVVYKIENGTAKAISKTKNVRYDGTLISSAYGNKQEFTDVIQIPGASSLSVTITYATEGTSYDWVCIYDTSVTPDSSNYSSSISGKLGGTTKTTSTFTVSGDTAQIYFRSDSFVDSYYGYYAEVTAEGMAATATSGTYSEPTKPNNNFVGWYTDQACSDGNEFNPTVDIAFLSTNIILYAKYEEASPVLEYWRTSSNEDFHQYKSTITEVEFCTSYTVPTAPTYGPWDVSERQDSSVMAYMEGSKVFICNNQDVTGRTQKIIANYDSRHVFYNFDKLTTVVGGENLDTGNVNNMYAMFYNCSSLKTIDVSNWDTTTVVYMYYMFYNCSSLTNLDVSGWDTTNVTDFTKFAYGCTNLTKIVLGPTFGTANLPTAGSGNGMFYVDSYVETTITGKSTAMESYDWAADNREGKPITVTFVANSGLFSDGNSQNSVIYNTKSGSPTGGTSYKVPAKDDYTFGGWYKNAACTSGNEFVPSTDVTSLSSDLTVYAKWTQNTGGIKVTYNANGGKFSNSLTTNTVRYASSPKISKTSNVSSDGSTFSGGYGNNQAVTDTIQIPGASQLNVTITYATESTSFDWVCIYDGTVTPSATNYANSVSGKLGSGRDTKTTQTFTVSGDTVQFFFRSDSSVDGYFGYYATVSAILSGEVSSPTKTDYVFAGWYTNAACTDGNEFVPTNITSDTTVYAKWTYRYLTVTYNANGGTFSSGSTTNAVIYDVSTGSIKSGGGSVYTPSKAGYGFVEWHYSDGTTFSTSSSNIKTLTSDVTVYATWGKLVTVTFDANGGTFSGGATTNAVVYNTGTGSSYSGSMKSVSRDGYSFAEWQYADGTTFSTSSSYVSSSTIKKLTSDITVKVRWGKSVTVTFDTNGGTFSDGSTTNAVVYNTGTGYSTSGSTKTPSKAGYGFVEWHYSDGTTFSTSSSNIKTLTSDVTVYATWKKTTVTVTYNANGGSFSGGSSTNAVTYSLSSGAVTSGSYKDVQVRSGYGFYGWYKDAACTSGKEFNPSVLEISSLDNDITVYAKWSSPKSTTLAEKTTWLTRGMSSGFSNIKTISFYINVNASKYSSWTSWDGSASSDGTIKVYYNGSDQLVVAGNGVSTIMANPNSTDMFYPRTNRLSGVTSINGIDILDTSSVTTMQFMFYGLTSLSTLDLSSFNTANVTDFSHMFRECEYLKSLDISSFNTSKATAFYYMFYNCRNLTSLDVSGFDTSKATSINNMFYNCQKLTNIDVSGWNTSNVTSMLHVFDSCSSLKSLNLSGWNTSNVNPGGTTIAKQAHFYSFAFGCSSLTSVTVGPNFATQSELPSASNLNSYNSNTAIYGGSMFYVSTSTPLTIYGSPSSALRNYNWSGDNRSVTFVSSYALSSLSLDYDDSTSEITGYSLED